MPIQHRDYFFHHIPVVEHGDSRCGTLEHYPIFSVQDNPRLHMKGAVKEADGQFAVPRLIQYFKHGYEPGIVDNISVGHIDEVEIGARSSAEQPESR